MTAVWGKQCTQNNIDIIHPCCNLPGPILTSESPKHKPPAPQAPILVGAQPVEKEAVEKSPAQLKYENDRLKHALAQR